MKASQKMNDEYKKVVDFNKFRSFYHTMNIDDYKINYKNFFDDEDNFLFEQNLATESFDLEAEDIFVDWLNKE